MFGKIKLIVATRSAVGIILEYTLSTRPNSQALCKDSIFGILIELLRMRSQAVELWKLARTSLEG